MELELPGEDDGIGLCLGSVGHDKKVQFSQNTARALANLEGVPAQFRGDSSPVCVFESPEKVSLPAESSFAVPCSLASGSTQGGQPVDSHSELQQSPSCALDSEASALLGTGQPSQLVTSPTPTEIIDYDDDTEDVEPVDLSVHEEGKPEEDDNRRSNAKPESGQPLQPPTSPLPTEIINYDDDTEDVEPVDLSVHEEEHTRHADAEPLSTLQTSDVTTLQTSAATTGQTADQTVAAAGHKVPSQVAPEVPLQVAPEVPPIFSLTSHTIQPKQQQPAPPRRRFAELAAGAKLEPSRLASAATCSRAGRQPPSRRAKNLTVFGSLEFAMTVSDSALTEKLQQMVTRGGGSMLDDIDSFAARCGGQQRSGLVLLAEHPRRTPKFLAAMAAGVPAVHVEWLRRSSNSGLVCPCLYCIHHCTGSLAAVAAFEHWE